MAIIVSMMQRKHQDRTMFGMPSARPMLVRPNGMIPIPKMIPTSGSVL